MIKKVSGIWMDSKRAIIIASENRSNIGEFNVVATIDCDNHEDADYKNDRVEQSRESLENKKYFKAIATYVDEDDSIFIFGPGKAQEQFKNFLAEDQNFNPKDIELGTSDKISEAEMKAKVKVHFS
jgi:stalled ribosome rescue protein Dom34